MRWIRNFTVFLMLVWIVGACLKQPENSIIPQIQLLSVDFKHVFPTAADTLILKVKFTDGDGDLGINGDDSVLYQSATDEFVDINTPFYFVYDTIKQIIVNPPTHSNNLSLLPGYQYVNYAAKRLIHKHPFDTLPALTCKDWEYRASPADTLYIKQNPNNFNIFVDVYTKNPDGTYTYFDPNNLVTFGSLCVTNLFNGRFPVLSSDLGKKSSLDGTITYKIESAALYLRFHSQTLKLKIYILDRALHKSNMVESDDFVIH